jgi:hypothetical protein
METQKFNPDNVIIRFNCQQNCTMEIIDVSLSKFMDSGGPVCCACNEKMEFMETFVKIPDKVEKEISERKIHVAGYATFGLFTSFTSKKADDELEIECYNRLKEEARKLLKLANSDFNLEEMSWEIDDEE